MDDIKPPASSKVAVHQDSLNSTTAPKKQKSKKRRRTPWLIVIFMIVSAAAALFAWYQYNQTPAQGIVFQSTATTDENSQQNSTASFKGKAISFDYLSRYSAPAAQPVKSPVTEGYILKYSSTETGSQKIAITVVTPKDNISVTEDSAYVFRKKNPALYAPGTEEFNGQIYTKMTKKDKTEVVYFVPGAQKYAFVVITTSNTEVDITKDASYIMQSINWL